MGACSHQLPLNYSISSSLADLTHFLPCSLLHRPVLCLAVHPSRLFVAPASPWCRQGPGWGDNAYSCWGWVARRGSWAALGSRWEKRKLEHLSCSPTDVLSHHPPFSTSSRANWFPSAISVCRSSTQGITQTHCEHFVPPLSQGGCNCFKFICKFTPLPLSLSAFVSHLSSQRFSRGLASPWGFFSPSHPSPHLPEPRLVTGWGRSCSSPRCVQSPLFPRSLV